MKCRHLFDFPWACDDDEDDAPPDDGGHCPPGAKQPEPYLT